MKQNLLVAFLSVALCFSNIAGAQGDKSKRPSPPVVVSQKLKSGATISIDYSQPSLKGRTIGTDVEPNAGKVWRAGANEATVFETDKDVSVEGKKLPAGKYALFMVDNGKEWNIIFNKVWKTWGAYDYEKNKEQDVLQVTVKAEAGKKVQDKLTYTIDEDGEVTLLWGDREVEFKVK